MSGSPIAGRGDVELPTVRLAVHVDGPAGAPLALLVHGFPDSPRTWRHLAPRLRQAGYRVARPWLRGLGPSGWPSDDRFDVEALATDLLGLHAALGGDDRAVLVGHDWGAVAGQVAVTRSDAPWRAAVLMAVPPIAGLGRVGVRRLPRLLGRMWYAGLLATPGSGALLQPRLDALVTTLWRRWSPALDITDEDLQHALAGLAGTGFDAQRRYYQALARSLATGWPWRGEVAPTTPTTYLHGADDGCVDVALARAAAGTPLPRRAVRILPGLGHFLHLEAPDLIDEAIIGALANPPG